MEVWKTIKGFENYEISNLGNVKRKECVVIYSNGNICNYKEKSIKKEECKGYNRVSLSSKGKVKRFLVHRLVAIHFISNDKNKPCVNHIDGDKLNNVLDNLEWCTYSENEIHSFKVLNKKPNGILGRKIKTSELENIRNLYKNGMFQKDIALKYNVSNSCIQQILNKTRYVNYL